MSAQDGISRGPHVHCRKHGTCVLECKATCNTKRLIEPVKMDKLKKPRKTN